MRIPKFKKKMTINPEGTFVNGIYETQHREIGGGVVFSWAAARRNAKWILGKPDLWNNSVEGGRSLLPSPFV